MMFLMIFSGVILSIIEANEWIIVPKFCIVFCYIMGFYTATIYSYVNGLSKKIVQNNKNKMQ